MKWQPYSNNVHIFTRTSEVTGDILGEPGVVGSSVARLINVQTFPPIPLRHSVSPIPSSFPSTTMYSVVSTVPVQSVHFMGEYDAL